MEIWMAIIGSSALSAVISGIFAIITTRKKKHDGVVAGLRMIMYDRIKYLGRTYLARQEITSEELEDLIAMHKVYHNDLTGNGYLDSVMTAVGKLPMK